jgi:methionine biosynthesis protein MetW
MKTAEKDFYSKKFAKDFHSRYRLKKVVSILKNYHFNRFLDVGCGDGSFSSLLKEFTDEVYGIDISENAVKSANEKSIKAYLVNLDDEDLPFEDNFFDAVFCGEVIEHLYDTDHLLDEIHRVLKPKGLCIITTPNLASWHNRLILLIGFQPYLTEVSLKYNVGKFRAKLDDISGHIRPFTYKSLKELVKLHSFDFEKAFGISIAKDLPFPVNLVEKLLSKRPSLALVVIIIVKSRKDNL